MLVWVGRRRKRQSRAQKNVLVEIPLGAGRLEFWGIIGWDNKKEETTFCFCANRPAYTSFFILPFAFCKV